MRNLALISILIIGLNACIPATYCKLKKEESPKQELFQPLFGNDFQKALYKAKIELFGNYFSGLLIIKHMPDSSYRFVFTNELGMKFFDFGISISEDQKKNFKVHYCFSALNRKSLLKLFEKDFSLLIMNTLEASNAKVFKEKKTNKTVFRFNESKEYNYYFFNEENGHLSKIENASGMWKKLLIEFGDFNNGISKSISYRHKNIKFKMQYNLLNQ